jgi:zinc/manganese transport system permease protein
MHWVFEGGFFSSSQVQVALLLGGVAAAVSAVVGVFTVIRGQSFAGHALTDASATGGAAGVLLGLSPLLGFLAGAVTGAASMDAVGARRMRGQDLSTGIVLGASIGLASLFLYLTTTTTARSGSAQQILFGSMFGAAPSILPAAIAVSAVAVSLIAVIHRPLLLASVDPDMATAQGVSPRLMGLAYMLVLAGAVSLSSLAIGAVLSTALLIGPPATALRVTRQIGTAVIVAVVVSVGAVWVGVLLAYDSAAWFSNGQGLPVSFFIVVVVLVSYAASGLGASPRRS